MTHSRTRAAAVIVAATMLAACGGGDDTAVPAAGTTARDTASATDDAAGATDVDEDAVYVRAHTTAPSSFDPIKSRSTFQYIFYNPVFDSLVTPNPDGTLSPGIAESWELSDDGTTFTMTLAEGRTFHDGTPIDAAAVKANLERAINSPDSTVTALDNVEAVNANGNTVTVTVRGAGGRLPAILADTPGMIVSPASFDTPTIDTNPIGSGPFTVAEVSDAGVRYERWDGYHAVDDILLSAIEIVALPDDNTRLAAVRSGEADATFIQASQRAEAEGSGLSIVSGQQNQVEAFNLNTAHPALAEPDVRKAISHAINREAIDKGLYDDSCEPTVQPYPKSFWAYTPDATVDRYGAYDPDAARELLASSGYSDGFEIEVGTPNTTTYTSLLEVIQAQLGEIGIEVTPVVQEPAQYISAVIQGDYDAWVAPVQTGRPDPLGFWLDNYMDGGARNPGNYSPQGFADLFDQAADAIEIDEQKPILQEMVEVSLESGPRVIFVCLPDYVLAANDRVDGLVVWLNGNISLRGITEANG